MGRPRMRLTLRTAATTAVVALLALPLVAGEALAQSEQTKAAAKSHFKRGKASFELGRFSEALGHYEKAYEMLPLPGFLFNIGQCQRNLNNHEKAIFSFRLYLQKVPKARNRAAVETLLEDLEAKAEAERKRKAHEQATRVPEYNPDRDPGTKTGGNIIVQRPVKPLPPSKPFYKQWWFWVPVAAVAIAGGAVGTYFAVRPQEADIPNSSLGVWEL